MIIWRHVPKSMFPRKRAPLLVMTCFLLISKTIPVAFHNPCVLSIETCDKAPFAREWSSAPNSMLGCTPGVCGLKSRAKMGWARVCLRVWKNPGCWVGETRRCPCQLAKAVRQPIVSPRITTLSLGKRLEILVSDLLVLACRNPSPRIPSSAMFACLWFTAVATLTLMTALPEPPIETLSLTT